MDYADSKNWDLVIKPHSRWFDIQIKDLWRYRDLVILLVKRDLITYYKQTILGPLWYIIQPLFSTVVFTLIFGKVAKIPTDGVPPFLFYLSGNVAWGYFALCVNETSRTFINNAPIFGKVYFPRLVIPTSVVIQGLSQFLIQFVIFSAFYVYFGLHALHLRPTLLFLTLPLILLQMALLGLGIGILISSLTTKYRDLTFAVGFGVQLWMYSTPIVYPLSQVPESYRLIYAANPMVSIIESFRAVLFGVSTIEPVHVALSIFVTIAVFVSGVLMFSKVERTFMDTI